MIHSVRWKVVFQSLRDEGSEVEDIKFEKSVMHLQTEIEFELCLNFQEQIQ